MPPTNRLSSRLAARASIRQIDAIARADLAALSAERTIGRVWRELLAILQGPAPASEKAGRARLLLQQLPAAVRVDLDTQLRRLATWGHKETVSALVNVLPMQALRVAGGPVEAIRESVAILEADFETGYPARPPSRRLTPAQMRQLYAELTFAAPSEAELGDILYSSGWQDRIAGLSRLAEPSTIAGSILRGFAGDKSIRDIAAELRPLVDGAAASARRLARTEGLRVANQVQQRAWEQAGDIISGFQIHATLDERTRPAHAARHGRIWHKADGGSMQTALGMEAAELPDAPNCRCWLTPVMETPEEFVEDPAKLAVFRDNSDAVIPDPATYADWFAQADERRRRLAVGSQRYSLVQDLLGRKPRYADFLDPEKGTLAPVSQLKRESPEQFAARTQDAAKLIAQRKADIEELATFGFEVERSPARLPALTPSAVPDNLEDFLDQEWEKIPPKQREKIDAAAWEREQKAKHRALKGQPPAAPPISPPAPAPKLKVEPKPKPERKPEPPKAKPAKPSKPVGDPLKGHPLKDLSADEKREWLFARGNARTDEPVPVKFPAVPKSLAGVAEDVLAAARQAVAANIYRRPTIPELFAAVRGKYPDMTIFQFQGVLYRLQLDRKIQLGPYTQALGTLPDAELPFVMPLDRESKYYVQPS